MDEKNYHSRLLHISHTMDTIIEKLKSSYIDVKIQTPWILWLMAAPLRDIAKVKKIQHGILTLFTSKAFLSILPILSAIFGPLILSFTQLPSWVTPFITGVLGYIISLLFYFPQLTRFNSDHFHLGAYKKFRKQEYELFKGAFLDNEGEFYFKGLYDYVTNSKDGYKMIEKLFHDFIGIERTEYKARISSLEQEKLSLEETIDDINSSVENITAHYEEFTADLISERNELLQEFEYVITLLKDLNTLLFRIHNKGLDIRDLNILTGFTLYKLKDQKLIQLADVGTSGVTATEIDINDSKYAHYGLVKVINEDLNKPYFNHPYPGHIVVSFKMDMDRKDIWVYNFHFDDSNTMAWKLLIDNGIIESKEIYRLIHAFCLLSQDDNLKSSKGAVNQ